MTVLPAPPQQQTEEPPCGMYHNLRQLINVVDELRDVGLQQYINLPRICVVGTQSAGKSSVLEAIVGVDFLPRGDGVVTRRPLELRLVHLPASGKECERSWAQFEGGGEKLYEFEAVKQKISSLTDEVAGVNKGIVDNPIVLTICGTMCPDLTLVDLPGITRVPLRGSDQTDDIERLTREMATRYAKDPRTVILAVIPANQDISTADALQLARKVDPQGVRTIGVITKVDLMDRGTNAARMVTGEEVPLRLGYVAVKNRSQQDIVSNTPIDQALKEERNFFRSHPSYRHLPPHLFGIEALTEKLTKVLFRHIRNFLPEIKAEIGSKLRNLRARLQELGDGVPTETSEKSQLMWTMINDFCELFCNTIRGKYDKRLAHYVDTGDYNVQGGAQIRQIFNELLQDFVNSSVTADMTEMDIDQAIRMHEGDSLPGFPSPDTFEYLILPHLRKITFPVMECLDRVAQCLELMTQRMANRVFMRFPNLASQILELSQNILMREKEKTRQILEQIVAAETGYLFTNDESYLTEHGAMLPAQQQLQRGEDGKVSPKKTGTSSSWMWGHGRSDSMGSGLVSGGPGSVGPTANLGASAQQLYQGVMDVAEGKKSEGTSYSRAFLAEIRRRLDAYFSIVLRNVRDTVPKAVGLFLVRAVQEALQFQLYTALNRAEAFETLLGEPPSIKEERQALQRQIQTLLRASTVLQKDPAIAALNLSDYFDDALDNDIHQAGQPAGNSSGHGHGGGVLQLTVAADSRLPPAPNLGTAFQAPIGPPFPVTARAPMAAPVSGPSNSLSSKQLGPNIVQQASSYMLPGGGPLFSGSKTDMQQPPQPPSTAQSGKPKLFQ